MCAGPVRTAQAISSGVSADELNRASRRVQRCLQLMAMAIEAGQRCLQLMAMAIEAGHVRV
eukprot:1159886-Pelagomonas_calceolata.AAC.3